MGIYNTLGPPLHPRSTTGAGVSLPHLPTLLGRFGSSYTLKELWNIWNYMPIMIKFEDHQKAKRETIDFLVKIDAAIPKSKEQWRMVYRQMGKLLPDPLQAFSKGTSVLPSLLIGRRGPLCQTPLALKAGACLRASFFWRSMTAENRCDCSGFVRCPFSFLVTLCDLTMFCRGLVFRRTFLIAFAFMLFLRFFMAHTLSFDRPQPSPHTLAWALPPVRTPLALKHRQAGPSPWSLRLL